MLRKLDDFVIDKVFQKVVDLIFFRWEVSCYVLAEQLIYPPAAAIVIREVWLWTTEPKSWVEYLFTPFVAIAMGFFFFVRYTIAHRAELRRLAGSLTLDQSRLAGIGERWWWFVLFSLDLWRLIGDGELGMWIFLTPPLVAHYFCMACTPKAPRPKPVTVPVDRALVPA